MMTKRTYVNKRVWHLGKGQRGDFFPYAGPLAGILAGPIIEKVVAPMLTGVIRKIVGRGRCRRCRRRRHF